MQTNYAVVSPSLDGVLSHESMVYEGLRRPIEVLRAFDSPARDVSARLPSHHEKILEQYFYDLYGLFMKKLSDFVVQSVSEEGESTKLQAILQEMIKIKKILR